MTRSRSPKHRRGESEWTTRSRSSKHRRGESEWIRLRLMDPTFSSTSRSVSFDDLRLALHTSTSAHHDVYTGGSLLHIMHHFQARTSTYVFPLIDILPGATFFTQILEGFLYTITYSVFFLNEQEMYDATHHFPHAHCSQSILEDFFLSSTSLFPPDP